MAYHRAPFDGASIHSYDSYHSSYSLAADSDAAWSEWSEGAVYRTKNKNHNTGLRFFTHILRGPFASLRMEEYEPEPSYHDSRRRSGGGGGGGRRSSRSGSSSGSSSRRSSVSSVGRHGGGPPPPPGFVGGGIPPPPMMHGGAHGYGGGEPPFFHIRGPGGPPAGGPMRGGPAGPPYGGAQGQPPWRGTPIVEDESESDESSH